MNNMNSNIFTSLANSGRAACLFILVLSTAGLSYGQNTSLLVYVNTGTPRDAQSMAALQSTVGGLNAGGNSNGYFYQLAAVNTFARAYELAQDKPPGVNAVIGIAHMIKDSDPVTVADTSNISELADKFDENFIRSFHCEAEGDIDNDDIGRGIAKFNFHKYRQTDGTIYDPSGSSSGSSSGAGGVSSGTGGGSFGTGGTWVTLELMGQYSYFKSDGTLVVVAYKYTVMVFISFGGNVNEQLSMMGLPLGSGRHHGTLIAVCRLSPAPTSGPCT